MFILQSRIEIGNFIFKEVVNIDIEKSVDLLSDTATIELPHFFVVEGQKERRFTEKEIKVGDKIIIELGYENIHFVKEFEGFVKQIKPGMPVKIVCEDSIYLLRKKTVNKNFEKTNIKEVLKAVIEGTGLELSDDIPNVPFDKFILKKINGAKALEKIKSDFGFTIYIDDSQKLYCGLRQFQNVNKSANYKLQENVIDSDLTFVSAEDKKIKIKAKGWKSDNTFIEAEVGDEDGEERTFQTTSVSNVTELKKLALEQISKLKYDGYEGSIETFLIPFVKRGMAANFQDEKYPNRDGKYFIPKVEVSYGTSGGRRKVHFGTKL